MGGEMTAPTLRMLRSLLALTATAAWLYGAQPALSAAPSGLVVVPHPSGSGLSYFKLAVLGGRRKREE